MSTALPERRTGEEHYIGIDVGTGSARACIINSAGDIKAVASKDIQTWQPKPEYYVRHFPKLLSASPLKQFRNNPQLISGTVFPRVFDKSYLRGL
jgi:glycerol kinase